MNFNDHIRQKYLLLSVSQNGNDYSMISFVLSIMLKFY